MHVLTVGAGAVFALASIGCAHRLRHADRAREYLAFVPFVIGGWVALITVRSPTAGRVLVCGLLLDVTIMLLACTGIFRMLGAFEADPWNRAVEELPTPSALPDGAALSNEGPT